MYWTKIDYELVKVDLYNWRIGVMAFMREYHHQHLQEHHKATPIDPMTEYAEDMGAPAKSEEDLIMPDPKVTAKYICHEAKPEVCEYKIPDRKIVEEDMHDPLGYMPTKPEVCNLGLTSLRPKQNVCECNVERAKRFIRWIDSTAWGDAKFCPWCGNSIKLKGGG